MTMSHAVEMMRDLCRLSLLFHKLFIGEVSKVVVVSSALFLAILLSDDQVNGGQQMGQVLFLHSMHPVHLYNTC